MRCISLFLFFSIIIGCQNPQNINSAQLEGYWEIEKVSSHGETFNPRGAAPMVDYYFLTNKKQGFRKKLAPSFGFYQTSEQQFAFDVEQSNSGEYFLHFKKALKPWKEKIIALDSTQLVLEHQEKVYHYIRHEKMDLNE